MLHPRTAKSSKPLKSPLPKAAQVIALVSFTLLPAAPVSANSQPRRATTPKAKVTYYKVKSVKALVTAYCPCSKCCGSSADGKTSTGRDAFRHSGVAVAPRAIPYGCIVSIAGVGYRLADDTGGAMRRSWRKGTYHLDLRFRTHSEALEWGRKWMKVNIYAQR